MGISSVYFLSIYSRYHVGVLLLFVYARHRLLENIVLRLCGCSVDIELNVQSQLVDGRKHLILVRLLLSPLFVFYLH